MSPTQVWFYTARISPKWSYVVLHDADFLTWMKIWRCLIFFFFFTKNRVVRFGKPQDCAVVLLLRLEIEFDLAHDARTFFSYRFISSRVYQWAHQFR